MSVRALVALLLVGCSTAQLNRNDPVTVKEPPCDAQNPYRCGDGSCCTSAEPLCMGPDTRGYYCEPPAYNPDDPTNMFAAPVRHYARKPGQ